MRTIHLIALALPLVAATGCVSKKKYNDLQSRYDALVGDRDRLQSAYDTQVNEYEGLKAYVAELEKSDKELASFYDAIIQDFLPLMREGKVHLQVVNGQMSLAFRDEVLFETAKADLKPEGRETVQRLADIIERYPSHAFHVRGHTDPRPIHTSKFGSNWDLGAARAVSVVQALSEAGVAENRLAATTFAANMPVASNESEVGWQQNRRVEIVFQPDFEDLPGSERLVMAARDAGAFAVRGLAVKPDTDVATRATRPEGDVATRTAPVPEQPVQPEQPEQPEDEGMARR